MVFMEKIDLQVIHFLESLVFAKCAAKRIEKSLKERAHYNVNNFKIKCRPTYYQCFKRRYY